MSGAAPRAGDRPLITCRNLALGYGAERVLTGVDWSVRTGETWFVLGPNGSGKTTLLRGVLGLLPPSEGRIERDPPDFLEHTGFVPQDGSPKPTLPTTVREYVALGAVGLSAERRSADALPWALERVGLAGLVDRALSALSGGQRRRALVARALVRRPRLLVLDEPTEGLDVASEESFLETLDQLRREEQLTLLFVTHELHLAVRYASHVALVADGVVRVGPRDAVLVPADLEAAFGVPPARLDELRL